ncbi:MAG: hypothetical protein H0T59_10020, partial [Chloroflexi bacterium]|nr:hypothetical protein [Chloroflexota bacterium]
MSRYAGFAVAALATVLYWLANRQFDAGRGDFFYLAEAFLNGRTWLTFQPGPNDVIVEAGRYYVPFAPFPAMALMPLVAIVGAVTADQLESGINAALAGASVGMCWWLMGRIGVASLRDRLWLAVLFGFSTQILWITTRGGVWHTGQLIATILTLGCLIELWGARRAWVVGLLAGAAFLTRAPLAFAMPFYALMLWPEGDRAAAAVRSVLAAIPRRRWAALTAAFLPAIVFFFAYNAMRFGSPLESGYALATLPDWLERQRAVGLFSIAHIPMNIDLLFLHLPTPIAAPPYFKPDGLGMSVFITSPGLLFALRADWRDRRSWWLAGAAVA